MNQIKQRLSLITPFRPRRAGAGFIACTLLLALLTGSVLATETAAKIAAFTIPEEGWLTSADQGMPQTNYDWVMSLQTPGWESLTTEEFAKQLKPDLPKFSAIFDTHFPENRFMRQLQYSIEEARNQSYNLYSIPWLLNIQRSQQAYFNVSADLYWQYADGATLTVGERNRILDDVLARADQLAREIAPVAGKKVTFDLNTSYSDRLNAMAKELSGDLLQIHFANVRLSRDDYPNAIDSYSPELQSLLDALTPEGYLDQTVAEFDKLLTENKDRFEYVYPQTDNYEILAEAYAESNKYAEYTMSTTVDGSLMPAWNGRGQIYFMYNLHWQTVDPEHVTVRQRYDERYLLAQRCTDVATAAAWTAPDWQSLDKTLKEALPKLAQEASTPQLTFNIRREAGSLAAGHRGICAQHATTRVERLPVRVASTGRRSDAGSMRDHRRGYWSCRSVRHEGDDAQVLHRESPNELDDLL